MTDRRVVITGIGPVTPVGIGKDEFWKNITAGKNPVKKFTHINPIQFKGQWGAEIPNFVFEEQVPFEKIKTGDEKADHRLKKQYNTFVKYGDNSHKFGLTGVVLALEDAGIAFSTEDNRRGIYVGNAMMAAEAYQRAIFGGIKKSNLQLISGIHDELDQEFQLDRLKSSEEILKFLAEKLERFNDKEFDRDIQTVDYKRFLPRLMGIFHNNFAIAGQIALLTSSHGPAGAFNTACSSSIDAIGYASDQIRLGRTDTMIAGGTEAPITYLNVGMFDGLRVLTTNPKGPTPFCIERDGFAFGEGAGFLVLEELEKAKARGAKIYAEVVEFAQSDDSYNMVSLHPDGKFLEQTMREAMRRGGISPEEVDYINTHGTATEGCDLIETRIIKNIFGGHADKLIVGSTKPMTGHSAGAIGGIEAIICAQAIKHGQIPPTLKQEGTTVEKVCDLNYSFNETIEREVRATLSNSMGFGGFNSTLALKAYGG